MTKMDNSQINFLTFTRNVNLVQIIFNTKSRKKISFKTMKRKIPFKMDREYLSKLYGFVTERLSKDLTGMYNRWKVYHKQELRRQGSNDGKP